MADPGPEKKKRLAKFLRMLGSTSDSERRKAFAVLERTMQSEGVTWSDVGNFVEGGGDDGKYTEAELQELGQAKRAEGVEAGIKIGMARASNGNGSANGHLTLPEPLEMAQYCHARSGQLKDARERDFISDMCVVAQRGRSLSSSRLSWLTGIYIKISGTTG